MYLQVWQLIRWSELVVCLVCHPSRGSWIILWWRETDGMICMIWSSSRRRPAINHMTLSSLLPLNPALKVSCVSYVYEDRNRFFRFLYALGLLYNSPSTVFGRWIICDGNVVLDKLRDYTATQGLWPFYKVRLPYNVGVCDSALFANFVVIC